jgi:glycosidase
MVENVIRTLTDGVKNIVEEYGIDGMRLDAIKHIPIQLAIDICKNAGNSYCIGEVYSSSPG